MNTAHNILLTLVHSALSEQKKELPEELPLEDLYVLACKHQIESIVYDGAIRCGVSKKEPVMQKLFQCSCRDMVISDRQMRRLHELYAAFDEAKIDYLPLKGCNMKLMYPRPELRAMNDADILIRIEQYDAIKPVLEKLNYAFLAESDCELKWQTKGLYLELHKRLIPSFIKDFYAYFGDGWQLAEQKTATRYALSKEDEFLYVFTHFARHYREGGVGIRHMADIWHYRVKMPELDDEKIRTVLRKMALETFYDNILQTLRCWFEGEKHNGVTKLITAYIGNSGSFGTEEAKLLAGSIRSAKGGNVKRRSKIGLIFPSVSNMRYAYPAVDKCALLLPVMWVYRWGKILFFRRDKLKAHQDRMSKLDNEKLDAFEESMRAVGLNFEFEEHGV